MAAILHKLLEEYDIINMRAKQLSDLGYGSGTFKKEAMHDIARMFGAGDMQCEETRRNLGGVNLPVLSGWIDFRFETEPSQEAFRQAYCAIQELGGKLSRKDDFSLGIHVVASVPIKVKYQETIRPRFLGIPVGKSRQVERTLQDSYEIRSFYCGRDGEYRASVHFNGLGTPQTMEKLRSAKSTLQKGITGWDEDSVWKAIDIIANLYGYKPSEMQTPQEVI